jgi:uncharacterized protein YndB with AHSA1/START domain
LVWEAWTSPQHIEKWWGWRDANVVVEKLDFRPGGAWRMIQRSPDGQEYAFRGSFLEIERPSRIVQTFEFEPMPGHISTDAMTLSEVDGGTKLTINSTFMSKEDLDGMMQSGMEAGANESYDRLEELLATLA